MYNKIEDRILIHDMLTVLRVLSTTSVTRDTSSGASQTYAATLLPPSGHIQCNPTGEGDVINTRLSLAS